MKELTVCTESLLTTHDLAIPLSPNTRPDARRTRQLLALLFAPSATTEDTLSQSIERIRHFACLTGGQDLVIVFLLNPPENTLFTSAKGIGEKDTSRHSGEDGVVAYTKLRAALLDYADIPHIPILLLTSPDSLSGLMKSHIASLTKPKPKQQPQVTPLHLLQLCTANPPMPQQTAFILSDLFPNLRELAVACTTASSGPNSSSLSVRAAGLSSQVTGSQGTQVSDTEGYDRALSKIKQLRDLVGEEQCAGIVEFWREEWTVD